MNPNEKQHEDPLNNDSVSSATGTHPVGTAVGAVGGIAAGAALGAAFGPLGALTGAAIGASLGPVVGKGIAEGIDPDAETAYWQRRYREEPYYQGEYSFDDYAPAYGLGWRLYTPGGAFETAEPQLSQEWETARGTSRLPWEHARHAVRASWDRVDRNQIVD